tara:strand:- start:20421 stop:22091 length:1671 start_codon:yes stop_codon:yes gene_type:complete
LRISKVHTFKLLFLLFLSLNGITQTKKKISIHHNNKITDFGKTKNLFYENIINNQINQLAKDGFLTSAVDSLSKSKDSVNIFISSGQRFNENDVELIFTKKPNHYIDELLNDKKIFSDQFSFSKTIIKALNYMNNIGYPFAKFQFNKSEIKNNKLKIICDFEKGPLVVVDSIYNPEMSTKELELIYKIIKIKNNDPFNLSLISTINEKLKSTNYFSTNKSVAYEFINNKAQIYCYAKNKPVNNMNGLLGLQPGTNGDIQLTGNLSLTFLNALKKGEMLHVNWRKMFNSSQNLITSFSLPYVLKSDFELRGNLNMIRKDSSFFNINLETKINYLMSTNYSIGVVYNTFGSTNLLASNYNSTSVTNFGFSLIKNKFNNIYLPTKGFRLLSTITTGIKKSYLNENNYEIEEKTPNYYGMICYEQYLSNNNRYSVKLKFNGSTIINNNLFENELSRIGGYQDLRGFDEESISVSSYAIGTVELNYLLEKGSRIFLLTDFCESEKKINTEIISNSYQSIGLGLNLSLNNGYLTMIYALGRETTQSFFLKTGKIHLGYTSYF